MDLYPLSYNILARGRQFIGKEEYVERETEIDSMSTGDQSLAGLHQGAGLPADVCIKEGNKLKEKYNFVAFDAEGLNCAVTLIFPLHYPDMRAIHCEVFSISYLPDEEIRNCRIILELNINRGSFWFRE